MNCHRAKLIPLSIVKIILMRASRRYRWQPHSNTLPVSQKSLAKTQTATRRSIRTTILKMSSRTEMDRSRVTSSRGSAALAKARSLRVPGVPIGAKLICLRSSLRSTGPSFMSAVSSTRGTLRRISNKISRLMGQRSTVVMHIPPKARAEIAKKRTMPKVEIRRTSQRRRVNRLIMQ